MSQKWFIAFLGIMDYFNGSVKKFVFLVKNGSFLVRIQI